MNNRIIKLNEEIYRDKVLGCWLGKNAGGTLGEPFEAKFGQEEMFNVSFYINISKGGIPNDDLEIQLVWLQALEEIGPKLKARDLAEYWLDYILYNFDEYGLSKANLKKGLLPPISGWYNNWFKNCMGSPIRSEIWACIAPGAPDIAAKYAFEDAICDHAGGESVYGEIFNAVVESCAFVIDEKVKLIETGLNFIPSDSLTYKAIKEAVEVWERGLTFEEAREKIKKDFYNPVAQYSPINLGFQTIAWLYGEDFGDILCKAVNCGWDTDCTAATLGAILGIILGAQNLPYEWIEPLGYEISTNIKDGGLREFKVPKDIFELTERICKIAKKVLKYWDSNVIITSERSVIPPNISYNFDSAWLRKYKPNTLEFDLTTVQVFLSYDMSPAIIGDNPTKFTVRVVNPHPEKIKVLVDIEVPYAWKIEPISVEREVPAKGFIEIEYFLTAPGYAISEINSCTIRIKVYERPEILRIPLVFVGGFKWLVSPLFKGKTLEDDCGLNEKEYFINKPEGWKEFWRYENDLEIESFFKGENGVIYLLHFIKSEKEQKVILGVPTNGKMKLWLNGNLLHKTSKVVPLRPNQGSGKIPGDGANYVNAILKKGWNQILIKIERNEKPIEAHFVIGGLDEVYPINNGYPVLGLIRSKFIWE
jgi:ADP-ribosylglycohydrolase